MRKIQGSPHKTSKIPNTPYTLAMGRKMYHGHHLHGTIPRKNSISSAAMSGDVIRKLLSSAGIRPSGLRPPYQTSLWSMTQKLGR